MINPEYENRIDWSDITLANRCVKIVQVAQDMLDYRWTVRGAARECCMSKSSISWQIEHYLKYLDNDLYHEVKSMLAINKRHTNARKRYYL